MHNRLPTQDMTAVILQKNGENFVFVFREETRVELMRHVGKMAADNNLPNFGWYDAALVADRVRKAK